MSLLRQGDILLVAIEAIPHGATPVPPVRCNGRLRYVLAVGEATGHAHTLLAEDRVEFYRSPEPDHGLTTGYLAVHGHGAVLEHHEHRALPLPPASIASSSSASTTRRNAAGPMSAIDPRHPERISGDAVERSPHEAIVAAANEHRPLVSLRWPAIHNG